MEAKKKELKQAMAFGMARTKMGYITKEQLLFVLSEDEERNLKTITEFAEEHHCNMVEVWFREDTNWGEVKFYKTYTFHGAISAKTFERLDIYKK